MSRSVSKLRPLIAVGLCALLAAAISAAAGVLGRSPSGRVAAAVGDSEYNADDLNAYLATVNPAGARFSRADAAKWLSRWVFFAALESEMAAQGMFVTDDHRAQAALDARQALELAADTLGFAPGAAGIATVIEQQALVVAVHEWAADEVPYDEGEAGATRILCSKHVMVASEAEADSVLSRLAAGEQFADLAEELSLDTGSASRGGDLGCLPEGLFVEPFERAAYAVDPGETTTVASEFGFHVIEVISHGPPTTEHHPQLDDDMLAQLVAETEAVAQARAEIGRQSLIVGLQDSVYSRYADSVLIDDYYGEWDAERFMVMVPSSVAS